MKREKHKLRDFLEIEQSGANKMFCPACGTKQSMIKEDTEGQSCRNCGLNMFVSGLTLEIWWTK